MASYVIDNVAAEEIVKLIGDVLGIPAAEEFYTKTEAPYAAVLTPAARVSAPDMGRYYARTQRYRIELYTKTKADTLRERFKDLIYSTIPAGEFDEEEVSYSSDRLYLTAIEFEIME